MLHGVSAVITGASRGIGRSVAIALAAAGLTVADLTAAIEAANRNDGAGRISVGEEALIVRSIGAIQTPEDLAGVVLATRDNAVIRVGDVARTGIGSLTRYGAVTKEA